MAGGGGGNEPVEGAPSHGGALGASVFGEDAAPEVALNLTALMDILSNLLFFMLASFGASILMMINATVPVQSSEKSDIASTKKAVTMLVRIKKDGFDVAATGEAQAPEELAAMRAVITLKGTEHDFAKLTEHLLGAKQKYPESDTVIITPDDGIAYGTMIKTMDAAREKEVYVSGLPRAVKLFPTCVVSTMVK